MTDNEFYDWLDRVHCVRFPMCVDYFERKVANPDEAKRAWFSALRNYSADSLTIASQQMFEDEDTSQKYPDKHPAILRSLAKSISYERGDRFPMGAWVEGPEGRTYAFHCGFCNDTGFVTCWLPAAVKCLADQSLLKFNEWQAGHWKVRKQGDEIVTTSEWCYHQLTVRCCCERGVFGSSWCKYQFNPVRNWRVFCPMDEGKSVIDSLVDRNNFLSAPKSEEFDAADYQFAN